MYKCKCCGANCDCGELIGGTCSDCWEEERQKQIIRTSFARIVNGPFRQMELEEVLSG